MIHEIQQTIWLDTPKGSARARFMIVNGDDCDIEWVCFHENGQVWCWLNFDVRVAKNVTMGIRADEQKEKTDGMDFDCSGLRVNPDKRSWLRRAMSWAQSRP